ncbi:MAG TPA: hypothetical protein VKU19_16005 [Bryobacteraceae bacterium]|nr:hypothetical protein [Bryobacteraceae bacterium]
MFRRWSGLPLSLIAAASLCAQTPNQPIVAVEGCGQGINFETGHYQIGTATITDPFDFLYWIRGKASTTQTQLAALLNNKPFTYQLAISDAISLIEQQRFLPDNAVGFRASVIFAAATNCHQNPNTLDLKYQIYSTVPPKILSATPESQVQARQSPQDTAGLTQGGSAFHFTPAGGYNAAERWYGGGNLQVTKRIAAFPLFDTLSAEGRGSSTMREINLALAGSAEPLGPIEHMDWRLNYLQADNPADTSELRRTLLSGQYSAATRPFAGGNLTARFGASIEGGNLHSNFPTAQLAVNTVPGAEYGALRFYGGLASRLSHNVFSASYGLELGSIGPAQQIDWRKHIVDVVDDFWIPLRPHYQLDVDARFTAGKIQVPGSIPATERFFGGNQETFFVPGDSWQIRASPYIRAIPANRFQFTSQGAGAQSFASANLTIAAPVKAWPLVPTVVEREAGPLLDGQITSATSVLQNHYAMSSPGFQQVLQLLEPLQNALTALRTALTSVQADVPAPTFTNCNNKLLGANFNLTMARRKMAAPKRDDTLYGSALAPLSDIPQVVTACVDQLIPQGATAPGFQQIRDSVAQADRLRGQMKQLSDAIQPAAAARAADETRFVRRTINTLLRDMNVLSIGPVAVFDVAHIGPTGPGIDGMRYGPGGGLRLSIASMVTFTSGYAWNINRQPGEGPGAVFFEIGIRDLFH